MIKPHEEEEESELEKLVKFYYEKLELKKKFNCSCDEYTEEYVTIIRKLEKDNFIYNDYEVLKKEVNVIIKHTINYANEYRLIDNLHKSCKDAIDDDYDKIIKYTDIEKLNIIKEKFKSEIYRWDDIKIDDKENIIYFNNKEKIFEKKREIINRIRYVSPRISYYNEEEDAKYIIDVKLCYLMKKIKEKNNYFYEKYIKETPNKEVSYKDYIWPKYESIFS